jgi:hypothetical protein
MVFRLLGDLGADVQRFAQVVTFVPGVNQRGLV